MAKELLVNVSRGEEVRVALVEDARLEEIYLERDSAASNVGNIYLGKVTNVEGSIQAAFVDFGYGRNGFLHVQDLHPDYFPQGGRWDRMQERVGKKIGRRDRPPIQDCLRRGEQIVVQIIKEGIGTKGPTLTSYPSIPGRFLVMMPGVAQMGVSKNIEDEEERRRLRKILDGLKPPKDVGFIIRTAGMGKTKTELERDFKYLTRLHEQIEHHKKSARPPTLLYSEGDLVTRTVRDVWSGDVDRVICDDPETALRIKQFFKLLMPRTKVNVQLYQGHVPLFHAAGIEQEIETMFSRHVPLPSGGSLVIDSTEAIVAIDVNSGKFREHADAEETAYRTDMEAADEICRQLRLRDLGGVVIVDFIDLRYSRHREALFNRLTDLFKQDKAKSRHLPMNEFGIVAITRQRMRPDLKKSVFMPCPWSGGTGYIKTPESMALDVMRRLRVAAADERVTAISVRLFPSVALHVLNTKRQALADLERQSETRITLRQDETLSADDVAIELLDERDGHVQIESLAPAAAAAPDAAGRRRRRRRRRPDETDQKAQKEGEARGESAALIDLPDLLELGELKLDDVEQLVEKLSAGESAAREAARKDPQRIILDALRSGSLFEDESASEQPAEEQAEQEPARSAEPAAQDSRGRRARGRGRGRDRDEQGLPAPQSGQARRAPDLRGSHALDAYEHEAEHIELKPDAEPVAPAAQQGDGHPGHSGSAQPREPMEDGRPRRRRRRGRRGRGGRVEAGTNGDTHSLPPEDEPQAPAEEHHVPHAPDEILDGQLNGNRADLQTHMIQRDPFEDQHGDARHEHGPGGRRRRRRRKGRGSHGHVPVVAPQGITDAALDARVNGNTIVPVNVPRPRVEGFAGAWAQQGEEGPRRGRRRRRRRGRGGSGQGQPQDGIAPSFQVSPGFGPFNADGSDEPPLGGAAEPIEPVFFEPDDSVEFAEPPRAIAAPGPEPSGLPAQGEPRDATEVQHEAPKKRSRRAPPRATSAVSTSAAKTSAPGRSGPRRKNTGKRTAG